jgi:hypothetical protein
MPLWGRGKARGNIGRDLRLVGVWDLDPSDTLALASYGNNLGTTWSCSSRGGSKVKRS